jgi:dimethylargininase
MRALVRRPSPRLGDGIVTHAPRRPVDYDLALAQWREYVRTLEAAGWEIVEAPPADECPDCVFVEDTLVMLGGRCIVTRPGAAARRLETPGIEQAVAALGYRIDRIRRPATLDGGDVLVGADTVLVGIGGRTNVEGARQLEELTGLSVTPVPVPAGFLHLKSAYTFLPDGTRVDANVVDVGNGTILVGAGDAAAAHLVAARGFEPVTVDISELEKLEGGVTCLSVRFAPTV